MNDAQYPWLILIPRRDAISEIYQLSKEDQQQLLSESSALAKAMASHFQPAKMNVANLGNIVAQLHLHHIARFENDPAWPGPVWGQRATVPYSETRLKQMQSSIYKLVNTMTIPVLVQ